MNTKIVDLPLKRARQPRPPVPPGPLAHGTLVRFYHSGAKIWATGQVVKSTHRCATIEYKDLFRFNLKRVSLRKVVQL